eukprot:Skav231033  [mRNA]  locus=scaffold1869:219579:256567:- [translate_table: standard]
MANLENLQELALEWYTTPPLPRVIKGSEWQALLHVACLEGHVGVALALSETGQQRCDTLDCEGYSPLLVAQALQEHPDIASALVRSGVDVNRGGGLFGSPLHVATVNFDPQMVNLLIRGKAFVNQTDADGRNCPLHVLMSVFDKAGGKRAGIIGKILLQNKADCNMMNSDKWAPLHLAARRGRGFPAFSSKKRRPEKKQPYISRVRTCPRTFDLNLRQFHAASNVIEIQTNNFSHVLRMCRGGSHMWTPLHLAGHACHVNVATSSVFCGSVRVKPLGDVCAATEPSADVTNSPREVPGKRDSHELLEIFKVDDDEDDLIEALTNLEEILPYVVEEEANHHLLLDPELICNEALVGSHWTNLGTLQRFQIEISQSLSSLALLLGASSDQKVTLILGLLNNRVPIRLSAGGIPTGLFIHVDPDPVLTTLCVVMASEDHVRDPSLRGRAVKLLHRLCFAFRSWRDRRGPAASADKLNHPPLDKQLIPCLVNADVFIAVEKAIMSYYDLSYRYKYEAGCMFLTCADMAESEETPVVLGPDFDLWAQCIRYVMICPEITVQVEETPPPVNGTAVPEEKLWKADQ